MGMSLVLIAIRIVDPIPGSPKIVSVSMLPPIILTKFAAILTDTIIIALRRACTTTTLPLDAPFARAVLMYSCRKASCILVRVSRR